ncbi:MAG: sigma-54-dependent Fis family transcriptional regulator [Deltaproteobacteria bacterium]|nr:sigma-54-dependent Fis family transcriptional regulator [Deltaproteobacteria bacterium]
MRERRDRPPPPALSRVLVVDDEENFRHLLSDMLRPEGYEVTAASDGEEALALLAGRPFDVVLCDLRLPRLDGWGVLDALCGRVRPPVVIMMSAYGDRDTALGVMKRGAYDYVSKPFTAEDVLLTLRKAEERERLRRGDVRPKKEALGQLSFANILAQSPKMLEIFAVIRKIADYKTTVLVMGESGTGKELIARALHFNSPRRDNPFVAVNCGAIPAELLESELFGHLKGSFTDAVRDKKGLFEMAHTGTLLLDEIGELPLTLQVKLLRALQGEEIRRVGSSQPTKVDARIVAATVKDLQREVREGRFRDDLYYRLNVLSIHLPPLRERREDIALLIDHFLDKHSAKHGIGKPEIHKAALRALMDYHWPGNVRELENTLERAVILAAGTIGAEDLPPSLLAPPAGAPPAEDGDGLDDPLSLKQRVRSLEESLIRRALELSHSNRTRAAKLLDISHRTLLYKMQEYGIK